MGFLTRIKRILLWQQQTSAKKSFERWLWLFAIAGLSGIWGTTAYFLNEARVQRLLTLESQSERLVQTVRPVVTRILSRHHEELLDYASIAQPLVGSQNMLQRSVAAKAAARFIAKRPDADGGMSVFQLMNKDGAVMASSSALSQFQQSAANKAFFTAVRADLTQSAFIGMPEQDEQGTRVWLPMARPLLDDQGQFVGAAVLWIGAETLLADMTPLYRGFGAQLSVVSTVNGLIMAGYPLVLTGGGEIDSRLPVCAAGGQGKEITLGLKRTEDEIWQVACGPVPGFGLTAIVALPYPSKNTGMSLHLFIALLLASILYLLTLFLLYNNLRNVRQARTIFDNAPLGICLFLADGTCQSANRAMLDLLGLSDESIAQLDMDRHPAWHESEIASLAETVWREQRQLVQTVQIPSRFGHECWFRAELSLIQEGKQPCLLLLLSDLTEQLGVAQALVRSEQRYRELYESNLDGITMTDPRGYFLEANAAFLNMMGGYTLEELRLLRGSDVTPLEYREVERKIVWEQALVRGYTDEYEKKQVRKDGTLIDLAVRLRTLTDEQGKHLGFWALSRDITVQKQSEQQRYLAARVIESLTEAVEVLDVKGRIVSVNAAFERITGYSAAEAMTMQLDDFDAKLNGINVKDKILPVVLSEGCWQGEHCGIRKDGTIYPAWLTVNVIRHAGSGEINNFVAVFSDITERKAAEDRILHLANHDALTGLANRLSLNLQLDEILALARRQDYGLSLMYLDLDNFKTINDSLGHQYGDMLLVEVARRLREALRESDVIARLGGDEFVVLLPGSGSREDCQFIVEKLLSELRAPYLLQDKTVYSSPSIGISLYPEHAETATDLLKAADIAMYHAKSLGRNGYQFYAVDMNDQGAERTLKIQRLREAIANDELVLYYQPLISVADGRVFAVEALVRWQDPQRGLILPGEFITLAEESGLIIPLGEWVMFEACRQMKHWADAGLGLDHVAINISPLNFRQSDFFLTVQKNLQSTGVDPAHVELEITEGALMENAAQTLQTLHSIRALGITLSIDDFGTGYSSLAYLKSFPVDRVKIDRSFVRDISETAGNEATIAAAIISLAHSIGLEVVAEGTELQEQVQFLAERGCDYVQGYYFSPPVPADQAEEYVRRLQAEPVVLTQRVVESDFALLGGFI